MMTCFITRLIGGEAVLLTTCFITRLIGGEALRALSGDDWPSGSGDDGGGWACRQKGGRRGVAGAG